MPCAFKVLTELRAAMEAEADARYAYSQAKGRAKQPAYDAFHEATAHRRAAEDAADALIQQRAA